MTEEDLRARVPLNGKAITLAQLAEEVGCALVASADWLVVADVECPVTAEQLQAALAAHTAQPPADPNDLLAKAIAAVPTTGITDPAALTAIEQLKAILTGSNGSPAVAARGD